MFTQGFLMWDGVSRIRSKRVRTSTRRCWRASMWVHQVGTAAGGVGARAASVPCPRVNWTYRDSPFPVGSPKSSLKWSCIVAGSSRDYYALGKVVERGICIASATVGLLRPNFVRELNVVFSALGIGWPGLSSGSSLLTKNLNGGPGPA